MKKTYLKPENTVVSINLETLIAQSPVSGISGVDGLNYNEGGTDAGGITEGGAREVIQTPDAWEEW
jgi:hypothetical protein